MMGQLINRRFYAETHGAGKWTKAITEDSSHSFHLDDPRTPKVYARETTL